ncbi:MAG: hypothetical protein RJB38_75 [Pseudomonadota bacterium]|jgi:hypothetical protein
MQMKKSLKASFGVLVMSLAMSGTVQADHHEGAQGEQHSKHAEHAHQHRKKCGHKAEKHGKHVDYEHDGHHHRSHQGHADECSGPEAEAPASSSAAPEAAKTSSQ